MNSKPTDNSQGQQENIDGSNLTVIAESIHNIRRVSLVMEFEGKFLIIYVLDPAKGRPNLCFKSGDLPLTSFEKMIQNKKKGLHPLSFYESTSPWKSPPYFVC